MFTLSGDGAPLTIDTTMAVVADLAILGYFYAMRSCELTSTPRPGRSQVINMQGVVFRDRTNTIIPHDSPRLHRAARVTVTFATQKNGIKQDSRTQERTNDPVMCPVVRLASLIRRIQRTVPTMTLTTPINTIGSPSGPRYITAALLRKTLRSVCTLGGGEPTYGFHACDIGTRSIRSGAAMGLFLAGISVDKIKMLGRWSSDAFLVYIRPQVLEWTNNMSSEMIKNNSFFDATASHGALTSDPRSRLHRPFNAASPHMSQMSIHH
jgi:hypothetical protein